MIEILMSIVIVSQAACLYAMHRFKQRVREIEISTQISKQLAEIAANGLQKYATKNTEAVLELLKRISTIENERPFIQ